MKFDLGVACVALNCATSYAFDMNAFFKDLAVTDKDSIVDIGHKILVSIKSNAEAYLANHEATASEYPYFNFIPMFRAGSVPDAKEAVNFSAKCFPQHATWAKTEADGSVTVTISTSGEPASGIN